MSTTITPAIAEALTAAAATEAKAPRAEAMRALAGGAPLPSMDEVRAAYRALRVTPIVHVAATVHSLGAPLGRVLSTRRAEEGAYSTTERGEFFCGGPRFPTETTVFGGFLFRVA